MRHAVDHSTVAVQLILTSPEKRPAKGHFRKHLCHLDEIPPSPPLTLPGGTHVLCLSPVPQEETNTGSKRNSCCSPGHTLPRPPNLLPRRTSGSSDVTLPSTISSPHPLSQPPLITDTETGEDYFRSRFRDNDTHQVSLSTQITCQESGDNLAVRGRGIFEQTY
jgi:hypothetical protein